MKQKKAGDIFFLLDKLEAAFSTADYILFIFQS